MSRAALRARLREAVVAGRVQEAQATYIELVQGMAATEVFELIAWLSRECADYVATNELIMESGGIPPRPE